MRNEPEDDVVVAVVDGDGDRLRLRKGCCSCYS